MRRRGRLRGHGGARGGVARRHRERPRNDSGDAAASESVVGLIERQAHAAVVMVEMNDDENLVRG